MSRWNHIESYREDIERGAAIAVIWSIGDVLCCDSTLTEDEAIEILNIVDRRHDAEIGINWEVITTHIEMWKANDDAHG